jgi:hypothetical protein
VVMMSLTLSMVYLLAKVPRYGSRAHGE